MTPSVVLITTVDLERPLESTLRSRTPGDGFVAGLGGVGLSLDAAGDEIGEVEAVGEVARGVAEACIPADSGGFGIFWKKNRPARTDTATTTPAR